MNKRKRSDRESVRTVQSHSSEYLCRSLPWKRLEEECVIGLLETHVQHWNRYTVNYIEATIQKIEKKTSIKCSFHNIQTFALCSWNPLQISDDSAILFYGVGSVSVSWRVGGWSSGKIDISSGRLANWWPHPHSRRHIQQRICNLTFYTQTHKLEYYTMSIFNSDVYSTAV